MRCLIVRQKIQSGAERQQSDRKGITLTGRNPVRVLQAQQNGPLANAKNPGRNCGVGQDGLN
jgi:hypothetical protein